MNRVRLSLRISERLNADLEKIAEGIGGTRIDVIRQGIALMKVAHKAMLEGKHLGLVSDATKLDTEIIGI